MSGWLDRRTIAALDVVELPPPTPLLSIAIFDAYDNGSFQSAAELSLLYCAVIGVLAVLARRFGSKEIS